MDVKKVAQFRCADAVEKVAEGSGSRSKNAYKIAAEVLDRLNTKARKIEAVETERLQALNTIPEAGEEYDPDRYEYAANLAAAMLIETATRDLTAEEVASLVLHSAPWLFDSDDSEIE
jgi:hypothetical protein